MTHVERLLAVYEHEAASPAPATQPACHVCSAAPHFLELRGVPHYECEDEPPQVVGYCVDLDTLATPADCRDWARHVAEKAWATDVTMRALGRHARWVAR